MVIVPAFWIVSILGKTQEALPRIDSQGNVEHTLYMTLSELLKPHHVIARIPCDSKDELISKLLETLYHNDDCLPFPKKEILDNIQKREQIGGTLLPSGLSVPHARLRGFEEFVLALATPREPITHGRYKIRLMSLMISSQSGGIYYLPTLAALTRISREEAVFSRLCLADNAENLIDILKERDVELV